MDKEKMNKKGKQKSPTKIDQHAGKRLRYRRDQCDLTRKQLGDKLGIARTSIEHYENASCRMSLSRAYELAKALGVSVDYFYEGFDK